MLFVVLSSITSLNIIRVFYCFQYPETWDSCIETISRIAIVLNENQDTCEDLSECRNLIMDFILPVIENANTLPHSKVLRTLVTTSYPFHLNVAKLANIIFIFFKFNSILIFLYYLFIFSNFIKVDPFLLENKFYTVKRMEKWNIKEMKKWYVSGKLYLC